MKEKELSKIEGMNKLGSTNNSGDSGSDTQADSGSVSYYPKICQMPKLNTMFSCLIVRIRSFSYEMNLYSPQESSPQG